MTGWLPEGAVEWQGRPVARRVADAVPRGRAVLVGLVRQVVAHDPRSVRGPTGSSGRGGSFDAVLDDGTGTMVVRWVGRAAVPGVRSGVRMCVEGTVAQLHGRNVVLNPLYRFEAPDAAPPDGDPVPVRDDDIGRTEGASLSDDTVAPDTATHAAETPGPLAQDGSSVS